MKHNLSVIINSCTNDRKFIQHTINQSNLFSSQIFIVYLDHFFDGSKENLKSVNQLIHHNPQVHFIKIPFINKNNKFIWDNFPLLSRFVGRFFLYGPAYWICKARFEVYKTAKKTGDYTLFLDADKIPDGHRFKSWLNSNQYQNFNIIKLANYWYFRKSIYQANTFGDSSILVKNNIMKPKFFFSRQERQYPYQKIPPPKARLVMGLDGEPLIHHYCWARNKKNMTKKIETWSHNYYRNWNKLIISEFSHRFNGISFAQPCSFKTVKPFIKF